MAVMQGCRCAAEEDNYGDTLAFFTSAGRTYNPTIRMQSSKVCLLALEEPIGQMPFVLYQNKNPRRDICPKSNKKDQVGLFLLIRTLPTF